MPHLPEKVKEMTPCGTRVAVPDIWLKEATPENNPHMLWETTYGNVYDMRNKTMRIMLHEKYDTFYDAKL